MTSPSPAAPKFTAIWQSEMYGRDYWIRDWLMRIFGPYISEEITDPDHKVVLDNAILFDVWIYTRDPAYYAQFKGKNAFLVHVHDEFYELGVDRYRNFKGVFRTYWSSVFNPEHVKVLPLGMSSLNPRETILPTADRRYAWSFIGEAGKCSRPEMARALSSVEPHISYSTTPVRGMTFWSRDLAGQKRIPREEFVEILAQSAFAPAPMGNANLECFRVYEALEAGAIPIVERRISLDYFRSLLGNHPMPTVRSWPQARRMMSELLQDPVKLNSLQQQCMSWWKDYQARLVQEVGAFLTERSASQTPIEPLRSSLPNYPFWQYFELLRHQTPRSLLRRLVRQVGRVLSGGRWRKAHNKTRGFNPS